MQLSAALFSGYIPDVEFSGYAYAPVGARVTFAFHKRLGVEAWGSYLFPTKTGLKKHLSNEFYIKTISPRKLEWNTGINVMFTFLEGRLGWNSSYALVTKLYFTSGLSIFGGTEFTRKEGNGEKPTTIIGGNIGVGLGLFFLEWLSLRFDYRQHFYRAHKDNGGGVASPPAGTLGLEFSFL